MRINKINYLLSNLNVVNTLIGYTFVVSLIIPLTGNVEGSSQLITIPYRAFSLMLSLLVLFLNGLKRSKYNVESKLFIFFWIAVLIRMFYDMEMRTDVFVFDIYKRKVWLLAIAGCFIPMISIYKSYQFIDLNFSFKLLFYGCAIIMIPSFFFSLSADIGENVRAAGNVALDPISFASIGITMSILTIYKFIYKIKINKLFDLKIVNAILFLLGFYLALRSGSRGPILGFLIMIIFWYCFSKGKLRGAIIFTAFGIIAFLVRMLLVNVLAIISPLTAARFKEALEGEDLSILAREESYNWFLDSIYEYPILGNQFARLGNGHYPGYAHNIFLDILLGFGIIGLFVFLFIVFKAHLRLVNNILAKNNYWIGLIMMQFFLLSISSGAYYSSPALNCSILLTLVYIPKKINLQR